jgi:hypothetical protein
MVKKYYAERITERSRRAVSLYDAIEAIEYIVEELGCSEPHLTSIEDLYRGVLEIRVIECSEGEQYESHLVKEIEGSIGKRVRIVKGSIGYGPGIEDLYRELVGLVKRDIVDIVRPLAVETALRGGVEYISILLRDARWVILEGEKHRVRIPWIDNAIAVSHTHPPASCVPSRPDIESCIELLSSGGILCNIVSTGCLFTLYLEGPLGEDDYEHLMKIYNRYDEIIEQTSDIWDLIKIIAGSSRRLRLSYEHI